MSDKPLASQATNESTKAQGEHPPRREWPLFLGVFVAYVLLSFGVVLSPNWPLWRQALFSKGKPPAAQGTLELTLIHTNDTWGYVEPCG